MNFVGEHSEVKVAQITFRASLGKRGQKSFGHTIAPQNVPAPTPMMKRHSAPVAPLFERTEGEMPPPCLHSPASLCITRCCKLQSVIAMNKL